MRIAQLSVMLVMTLLIVSVGSQFAYAEQGFSFVKPDFLFKITNFVEDIRIQIADTKEKVELIKEFALDKQTRIDTALERGEQVSLELEERRTELITKADTVDDNTSPFKSIKDELNKVAEYNQIMILYSQFPDCIENCTDSQKQDFNDKVNSLDSWKNKCSGTFDIENYRYTIESFDKLKDSCPDLNNFTQKNLQLAVTGKV
jgi:hypothetical protein